MADWKRRLAPADYARVFGPPTRFKADGIPDFVLALYGGVLTSPASALAYARVLLQTRPGGAAIAAEDLRAVEEDKVWIIRRHRPNAPDTDLLRLSRETGKILAGAF